MTASQVTLLRAWTEGSPNGRQRKCWRVTLATDSGGQGGTTNTIPASLFEMSAIEEATTAVDSNNNLIVTSPSYDGTVLYLYDVQNATDASRDVPADFTSTTLRLTVKGYA